MPQDTNINIIQLIKTGEISVNHEISNIRAKKDINVHIRTYLEKSNHYETIQEYIKDTISDRLKAQSTEDMLFFDQKLQDLYKVEQDFIFNTLYLAETLSKIEPRTEKLKKAIEFFDQAKIKEADEFLGESDLLNDQFNLIAFVEYQRNKIKSLENDLSILLN